jgi:hypothetical protein
VEKYGTAGQTTDDNIIWHMRFARWITKATNTGLKYVILIDLPRQQRLCERASMLRLYVHCLSCLNTNATVTGAIELEWIVPASHQHHGV